ncbi:MAG: hypothetical protein AAF282_14830 [Cyanobacteria bacterium P01_A01_bin.15]
MATSTLRLQLDRAVRYAVSDALAAVKSHMYDLEYVQRRSPQELTTWNNYLVELRALHQRLLNLPSLETAQWLGDERAEQAPTFTPFVNRISDAKTNIRRVHSWLISLSQAATTGHESDESAVALLEQKNYSHQVAQALKQLERLPAPGSEAWLRKYQSAVEASLPVQQSRVRAVA